MKGQKNALTGVMGVTLILLLLAFTLPGIAGEGPDKVWTGKKPVPAWWTWGNDFEKSKPVRGGYFRTANPNYIGLMNPNHWPVSDWVAMTYFYEMLIYNDSQFKPTVPWLAESWEYTDPLTCVMKLRQGVQFHDGSPFNAESLKYQIEWVKDRQNGAWTRGWIEPVKSIEVVNEYTVKWTFSKPWGSFLGIMANVPGYPISKKALENDVIIMQADKLAGKAERAKKKILKLEEKAKKAEAEGGDAAEKAKAKLEKSRQKAAKLEAQAKEMAAKAEGLKKTDVQPVGTGKFMLEEASPGNYLKLKRNPNWWFGKAIGKPAMPYFDGIKINVIPDPSVRLANLRAGKLDSMYVEHSQYNLIKNDPNLNAYVYPLNWQSSQRFNTTKGPCKDIRVRQAISHAIDRKAIIAGVTFGLGIEASCMYPESHWGHNPDLKPVKYDPELSKKLLAEAGYADGLTIKGYMGNQATFQTTAEAIKNMLAQVGVEWKVDILDPAAISERMRSVDYDFAQGGWTWILDPDLMATGLFHPEGGFNFGRSNNEKAIHLIEAARKEVDQDKRQKMYWEIEKAVYDNYEDAWLYWPQAITVFSKNVLGWNNELYLQGREGFWFSHCRWFKDGKP